MSQDTEQNVVGRPERQPVRNVAPRGGGVPDLTQQAMLREFQRMLREALEPIQEHLEQLDEQVQRGGTPQHQRQGRGRPRPNREDLCELSDHESEHSSIQSVRQQG